MHRLVKAVIAGSVVLATALGLAPVAAMAGEAVFSQTRYVENRPYGQNPILPGFYPDPSIERVGDDYYLINSSFAFWPGIPVFHSRDLINWQQIGNAIDRTDMLDFSGLGTSRGVFAPDLSYHDGTYYILNTCVDCKGNFLITAKDPKGPWSDPVWLPFDGIDPSLFWDDDGRAYIVNNGGPDGPELYSGHRALWMQELDLKTMTMTGPRKALVNGGADISAKPVWIEGPHLFKKDGLYYLMAAEGGTEENHSEVVFRSDTLWGPYQPYAGNPILTQRDLDPKRAGAITSSGHADLVQTQKGDWYAVFLATRPYTQVDGGQDLFNTGRETFLLPVTWTDDGWPVILPHATAIPLPLPRPDIDSPPPPPVAVDNGILGFGSLYIRTPAFPFISVSGEGVRLRPMHEAVGDVTSHPAFLGRRLTEARETVETTLDYVPALDGDRAGLVALQSDNFYVFFGLARHDGKTMIELTRRAGPGDPRDGVVIASAPAPDGPVPLKLAIDGGRATFTYGDKTLAQDVDVTNLSTAKAGGFVGTIIGIYGYDASR